MDIIRYEIKNDRIFIYTEIVRPYRNITKLFTVPKYVSTIKVEAVNYLITNQIPYRIIDFINFEDLFQLENTREFRFTFSVYLLTEMEYFIEQLETIH